MNEPKTGQMIVSISLGKPSLRRRLEAYYQVVAPDQLVPQSEWLKRLDQIYDKFGGTNEGEAKLATKLAKKYGTTVRFLTAEAGLAAKEGKEGSTRRVTIPTESKYSEDHYAETDQQRGSGVIDFCSPRFDSHACLKSSISQVLKANPWMLETQRQQQSTFLDRVDQCRRLLPVSDPKYFVPVLSDAGRQRRLQQQQQGVAKGTSSSTHRIPFVFKSLAEPLQHGPFALLYNALQNRKRVRIVIRYVNSIRGILTGYLIAFDKHFNLLLRDVEETYTPRVIENHESSPRQHTNAEQEVARRLLGRTSSKPSNTNDIHWTVRQRHMSQLLVRGDNVVNVYLAEQEQSAFPVTDRALKSIYRSISTRHHVVPPEQRIGTPGSLRPERKTSHSSSRPSKRGKYDYRQR